MPSRVAGPRTLAALLVSVVAITVLDSALGEQALATYAYSKVALSLLPMIACAVAARGFACGDYLARGWSLYAAAYFFFTICQVVRRWPFPAGPKLWIDQMGLMVGSLVCTAATLVFALSFRAAGLPALVSRRRQLVFTVLGVAVAFFFARRELVDGVRGVVEHGPVMLGDLVSPICDFISLSVFVPLTLTAVSFRGGALAWVYGLLALQTFGWIVNEASDDLAEMVGVAAVARPLLTAGFALGALGLCAAAYMQRVATRVSAS